MRVELNIDFQAGINLDIFFDNEEQLTIEGFNQSPIELLLPTNQFSGPRNISLSGSGAVGCQSHVIDITAGVPELVPQTFPAVVCGYAAYDSVGNEITLGANYNPATNILEVCSNKSLSNILITVEGEL